MKTKKLNTMGEPSISVHAQNGKRLLRFYETLIGYKTRQPLEECHAGDIITDIMHFAATQGWDADAIRRCADGNFTAEVRDEGTEPKPRTIARQIVDMIEPTPKNKGGKNHA